MVHPRDRPDLHVQRRNVTRRIGVWLRRVTFLWQWTTGLAFRSVPSPDNRNAVGGAADCVCRL
jgi:hypothetical protein